MEEEEEGTYLLFPVFAYPFEGLFEGFDFFV